MTGTMAPSQRGSRQAASRIDTVTGANTQVAPFPTSSWGSSSPIANSGSVKRTASMTTSQTGRVSRCRQTSQTMMPHPRATAAATTFGAVAVGPGLTAKASKVMAAHEAPRKTMAALVTTLSRPSCTAFDVGAMADETRTGSSAGWESWRQREVLLGLTPPWSLEYSPDEGHEITPITSSRAKHTAHRRGCRPHACCWARSGAFPDPKMVVVTPAPGSSMLSMQDERGSRAVDPPADRHGRGLTAGHKGRFTAEPPPPKEGPLSVPMQVQATRRAR